MANLYFEAVIDTTQMYREMREMAQRMNMATKSVVSDGQEIDKVFKRIGQAAAGYLSVTAATGFLEQVVKVRGEFQQLDIALQTMLGNKAKSDKLMGEVVQLAAKTPFSLTELGQGAKQLIAFKEPAEKVADTLKRIGDVAAGVSVPVGDLVSAYGKVSAKGKMQAEELNQFAERGVPIISELAKVIGTTDDKIYKMAEDGKIGFKELQQAIMNMTSEGGQFFNLMEKQAGSMTGLVSNLWDAWDRMLNDIGKSNEGVIADSIKGLTSLVDNYEEIIKVLGFVVATYGAYKGAIIAASLAQKAEMVVSAISSWVGLSKSITAAKDAQIAFNIATKLNPLGLAASAITALVGGLLLYNSTSKETQSATDEITSSIGMEVSKLNALFGVVKNTSTSKEAQKAAIDEINTAYAPYLENLITEKSSLEDIEEAQRKATDALIADIGLKKSKEKMGSILEDYAKVKDQLVSPLINEVANVMGEGMVAPFIKDLDKMVEYSTQYGLKAAEGYSTAYDNFYAQYGKPLAQAHGNMKYDKNDVALLVQDVAEKRQLLEPELKKIQGMMEAFRQQTSKPMATDPDVPTGFDAKEYEKSLKDQKALYEKYEAAKSVLGEEEADKLYPNLLESYKDYLFQELEAYKDNLDRKRVIAQAMAAEGIDIRRDSAPMSMATPVKGKELKITGTLNSKSPFPSPDTKTLKAMGDYDKKGKEIEKTLNDLKKEKLGKMGQGFIDAGYAMHDLAGFAGEFDEQLGKTIGQVADLAGGIGNAMKAFSSGNIFAQIGAVAQVATSVFKIFDKSADAQAKARREAERMAEVLEQQNNALERQIRLMNEASGDERVQAEADTLKLINEQISALDKKAQGFTLNGNRNLNYLNIGGFSGVEDLEKQIYEGFDGDINIPLTFTSGDMTVEDLMNMGFNFKNIDEAQGLIDKWVELKDRWRALMEEIIGTTSGEISTSIFDSMQSGMTALESITQSFEDSMRNAILKSFETQFILPVAKQMFDEIAALMDPTKKATAKTDWKKENAGGTDAEFEKWYAGQIAGGIESAKEKMKESASGVQEVWDVVNKAIEDTGLAAVATTEDVNALSGGIRRELTEETGTRLAGLFNVMSLDTRSISTDMKINMATTVQQLNQLIAIEFNTAQTAVNTSNTVAELQNAVAELKSIKNNTSSTRRAEGW